MNLTPKDYVMQNNSMSIKNPRPIPTQHPCHRYHDALLFPLSDIFPKIFFLKNLDHQWVQIFHELYNEEQISRWEENLDHKKLEVLLKSSTDYLDHHEKEAIFVFSLRTFFKNIRHDHIGLKDIVAQSKELLNMAQRWEQSSEQASPLRSLGQSYLLFILTLNNSVYSPAHQKKVLSLAHAYGKKAQQEGQRGDHPYFNLLFCLIHIASGQWDQGTRELHTLALKYPDPKLHDVLIKLYIKLELPNVAQYFAHKKANYLASLTPNSNLRSFSNCA